VHWLESSCPAPRILLVPQALPVRQGWAERLSTPIVLENPVQLAREVLESATQDRASQNATYVIPHSALSMTQEQLAKLALLPCQSLLGQDLHAIRPNSVRHRNLMDLIGKKHPIVPLSIKLHAFERPMLVHIDLASGEIAVEALSSGSAPSVSKKRPREEDKLFKSMNKLYRTTETHEMSQYIREHPTYFDEYHREFERRRTTWDADPPVILAKWIATNFCSSSSSASPLLIVDYGAGHTLPLEVSFPTDRLHGVRFCVVDYMLSKDVIAKLPVSTVAIEADVADRKTIVDVLEKTVDGSSVQVLHVFCLALCGRKFGHYMRSACAVQQLYSSGSNTSMTIYFVEAQFRFQSYTLDRIEQFFQSVLSGASVKVRDASTNILADVVGAEKVAALRPKFTYVVVELLDIDWTRMEPMESAAWDVAADSIFVALPE
jgi:hypothetical protein